MVFKLEVVVFALLALPKVLAQDAFTCDLQADDFGSCPYTYDGECDRGFAVCETGDCFDCDPCRNFNFDCGGCLTAGCSWCPLNAFCFSEEMSYLSALNGRGLPECSTTSPSTWITGSANTGMCSSQGAPFSDPLYEANKWAYDLLNVIPVWERGFTGAGVRVRVNDNGVDTNHPEFAGRYVADDSCDGPAYFPGGGDHGTFVASVAAGAGNNDDGAVGIAPEASLSSCIMSFGAFDEAFLGVKIDQMDISVNSWNVDACRPKRRRRMQSSGSCPFDPFAELSPCFSSRCDFSSDTLSESCREYIGVWCNQLYEEDPDGCNLYLDLYVDCDYTVSESDFRRQEDGLVRGIEEGRNGLGVIFVFAAGNEYRLGEPINGELHLNSRYTIAVGAVGKDGLHSSYSSVGAPLFISAPGGDRESFTNWIGANPTDETFGGGYLQQIGTSFACPAVAGVIALMLEANPSLTWRDVQGILASTAIEVTNDPDVSFTVNAAGYKHAYEYGFGLIDANAAVTAALSWVNFPVEREMSQRVTVPTSIPDDSSTSVSTTTIDDDGNNFVIETVRVEVDLLHPSRGDLEIVLTSPSGVESILHPGMRPENAPLESSLGLMTVRNFGESPFGAWTLSITDKKSSTLFCADLNYSFTTGAGGALTCSIVESGGGCVGGAVSSVFLPLVELEGSTGTTALEACCACGGGDASAVPVVAAWTLKMYGHVEGPVTPTQMATPSPSVAPVAAAADSMLFPFGASVGDDFVPRGDDLSFGPIVLPEPVAFLGGTVVETYVNSNGHISFGQSFTNPFAMMDLPDTAVPTLIAAYWTDIDTTPVDQNENEVWFRLTTDSSDLADATRIVNGHIDGAMFSADTLLVVTWHRVGPFGESTERNSFQAGLAYNGNETWVILSYNRVEFYTTFSNSRAIVGFNSLDGRSGETAFSIESDADVLRLLSGTNCGVTGVYAFDVTDATPNRPVTPDSLPLPFGDAAGHTFIGGNDDGGSAPQSLPSPMVFFGSIFTEWYLNTNGHVSLGESFGLVWQGLALPNSNIPAIAAPYWVDIDTREGGVNENELWVGTSQSESDISLASAIVNGHPDGGSFSADVVAVATWHKVSPFGGGPERNSFQAILAYNSTETWVIFGYSRLEFYSFGAYGALNGGSGIFGEVVFDIQSDFDMELLLGGSNCNRPGVYTYKATGAMVEPDQLPLPFGLNYGDVFIPGNDDGSSSAFGFPEPILFYGERIVQWYLNTNGILSFDEPATSSIPVELPDAFTSPLVAVYWVDIDTRAGGVNKNELWARTSTSTEDVSIASIIVNGHPDGRSFVADGVSIASWHRVEAFGGLTGTNTFQATLAYNANETWAIFAYSRLEFYGSEAIIGFNAPGNLGETVGVIDSELDMSALLSGTNCEVTGVYAYKVSDTDQSTTTAPPTTAPVLVPTDLSLSPTSVGSDVQSNVPTNAPGGSSSPQPTFIESDVQSDIPSVVPSDSPSPRPTFIGSDVQSDIPSNAPSDSPSLQPTQPPTMTSVAPSSSMSEEPSTVRPESPSPTLSPQTLVTPTSTPTLPLSDPTPSGTEDPTVSPTLIPEDPTASPTTSISGAGSSHLATWWTVSLFFLLLSVW